MSNRWLVAVAGAAALLLVGCSSPTPTIPTPASTAKKSTQAEQSSESSSTESSSESSSTESSSTADEPAGAPLDSEACVEVTGANLDLATAAKPEDARTAADTLEKYEPPQSVKEAIEHFVGTGGAQFDDPDYTKFNDTIDKWVKQVCP